MNRALENLNLWSVGNRPRQKTMKYISFLLLILFSASCTRHDKTKSDSENSLMQESLTRGTFLVVLGTVQDGGSPHIGCKKDCCKDLFLHPDVTRKVVSLGVVDCENKMNFIFEATPDFPAQLKNLQTHSVFSNKETPDGIFLTHAHIGHYTGLMYLGKEAMNSNDVNVYALPRMKTFLETNGPWSQLVNLRNIKIIPLQHDSTIQLTSNIKVTPILVPHRDEFSETCGYIIEGPHKKILFIPDIDKWEKWGTDIVQEISKVDYAFIDGTFYDGEELNNRNMAEIPHPFISESMNKFESLTASEKISRGDPCGKIYFIHFNHTNPALNKNSKQSETILKNGFHIAYYNEVIGL